MYYKQIRAPRPIQISRKIAEAHAALPNIRNDRQLKQERIEAYKSMIANRTMRPVTWATARCVETGETYRVNGQHTAHAYMQVEQVPEDSYAMLEEYVCDTLEDVARLYQTFDSKSANRSQSEIFRAFAGTNERLGDVQSKIVDKCVSGIAVARGGGRIVYDRFTNATADKAIDMLNNIDFVVWVNEHFKNGQHSHMVRVGCIAAMFSSWQKCQRDCKSFWLEVRDETNTDSEHPSRKLSRFLLKYSATAKAGRDSIRHEYVVCLQCWNSYRKKKPVRIAYQPTAEVPAVS
jgi:hypothetical protein